MSENIPLGTARPIVGDYVRIVHAQNTGAAFGLLPERTTLLSVLSLTSLYHVSAPVRTPWRRDLPGALLTITIWFLGSYVVRWVISVSVGGTSIYGPLAAPIAVLVWLYVTALAVLIGAALNASVDRLWPEASTARARLEQAGTRPSPDVDDV